MIKVGLSALAAATIAVPGWAQIASDREFSGGPEKTIAETGAAGEIVVTAQRRSERIVDVPIAVTAFDDEDLERRSIVSPATLQQIVPNLSFTATNFGGSNFTLRGIGRNVVGDGADSGVAFHFNGAFLQSGGTSNIFYDVEAVEVLRGPQGTLFGRNATGGAINIRSHRPEFDTEASAEFTIGNHGLRAGEAMVNLAVTDQLALRFAGFGVHSDGDVRNIVDGSLLNGEGVISSRGSLRWRPGGNTSVDVTVNYLRARGDGLQAERRLCARDPIGNLGCLPDRLAFEHPNFIATLPGLLANDLGLAGYFSDPYANAPNPGRRREIALDFRPTVGTDEWIVVAELEHRFETLTLNLLANYASERGFYETDPDFTVAAPYRSVPGLFPGGIVPVSAPDPGNLGSVGGNIRGVFNRPYAIERGIGRSRQWLGEARLASSFDGPFDFLIGGFFLDFDRSEDFFSIHNGIDAVGLLIDAVPPFLRIETPVANLQSYAAFGEVYVRPTENLTVTGGLRWTRDRKDQANRSLLFDAPQPLEANRLKDSALTGRLVIDWTPQIFDAGDSLFYASYSRGYKGGGFNPQGRVAVAATFAPETIDAFEFGAKLATGRVALNLAAFQYNYSDLQISKIVNQTSVNENIDARIRGIEIETSARFGALTLDASLSHLDTRIGNVFSIDPRDPTGGNPGLIAIKDTDNGSNCVATFAQLFTLLGGEPFGSCGALGLRSGVEVGLKGNRLPNAPRFSARLGAQLDLPVGGGEFFARADVNWRGDAWGRIFNLDPVDRLPDYAIVNLTAGLSSRDRRLYGRVQVTNLFDTLGVTGLYLSDATSGLATNQFLTSARSVSATVGVKF